MTPKPTAELSKILKGISNTPMDETGIESTFTIVADIISRWGRYTDASSRGYHLMVIVITDGVRDGEDKLKQSVELA